MNKEITQLIRTLNGGLQQLPDLAKQMVNQYVVGHAVMGVTELILAIIIGLICYKLFGKIQKLQVKSLSAENSYHQVDDQLSEMEENDASSIKDIDRWSATHKALLKKMEDYNHLQISINQQKLPYQMAMFFCGGVCILAVVWGLTDIYRALTPIWSIIQALR